MLVNGDKNIENIRKENNASEHDVKVLNDNNFDEKQEKNILNHDSNNDTIIVEPQPPMIPRRKSKRKFLEVSTQTESIGLTGCICCCTCGKRNSQ